MDSTREAADELARPIVRGIGSAVQQLQETSKAVLECYVRATGMEPCERPPTLEDLDAECRGARVEMRRVVRELGVVLGLELAERTGPRTFRELQSEVLAWRQRNFPHQVTQDPALGVAEEVGELWEAAFGLAQLGALSVVVGRVCHAELKLAQGIRGTPEELRARFEDALGDLLVFAANLASHRDVDLQEVVDRTWQQVQKRAWWRDPIGGDPDA